MSIVKQRFFLQVALLAPLLASECTLAYTFNLAEVDSKQLETTVEEALKSKPDSKAPQREITGIKCYRSNEFFEGEGLNAEFRKLALTNLAQKIPTASPCKTKMDFSLESILDLQQIPVDELSFNNSASLQKFPQRASTIECLKEKSIRRLYFEELKAAQISIWSDRISDDIKKAIIKEVQAQNPDLENSPELQKKWLSKPATELAPLFKGIKQSRFCFVDLAESQEDKPQNYLVSLGDRQYHLTPLIGILLDIQNASKTVGGGK